MPRPRTLVTDYPDYCMNILRHLKETGEKHHTKYFQTNRDLYVYRVKFYKFLLAIKDEYHNTKDEEVRASLDFDWLFYCAKNLSVRINVKEPPYFVTVYFPEWADARPNLLTVEQVISTQRVLKQMEIEKREQSDPLRHMRPEAEPPNPDWAARIRALEAKPPELTIEEQKQVEERLKAMKGGN